MKETLKKLLKTKKNFFSILINQNNLNQYVDFIL